MWGYFISSRSKCNVSTYTIILYPECKSKSNDGLIKKGRIKMLNILTQQILIVLSVTNLTFGTLISVLNGLEVGSRLFISFVILAICEIALYFDSSEPCYIRDGIILFIVSLIGCINIGTIVDIFIQHFNIERYYNILIAFIFINIFFSLLVLFLITDYEDYQD